MKKVLGISVLLLIILVSQGFALPQPKIFLNFEDTDGFFDNADKAWRNRAPNRPEQGKIWANSGSGFGPPIVASGAGINGSDCLDLFTFIPDLGGNGGTLYYGKRENKADSYFANTAAEATFDNAISLTVTGWYNTNDPAVSISDVTLAGKYQAHLFAKSAYGFRVYSDSRITPGVLRANVRNDALSPNLRLADSDPVFTAANEWVFFAVVYDGTITDGSDNVWFYIGNENDSLSAAGSGSFGDFGPIAHGPGDLLAIGNVNFGFSGTSSFRGYLDNLRVYSSHDNDSGALSANEIEIIRQMDLNVPGPFFLPGDINEDFVVDFDDATEMADSWLDCTDVANANCE